MQTLQLKIPRPHLAQQQIINEARRFNTVVCGRRFGKSMLGRDRLIRMALEGKPTAYFSPTYRMLAEFWRDTINLLYPVMDKSNVQEKRIALITGGTIDMWSLDHPDVARGRKYARVVIDEAAMIRDLEDAWQAVIRPTLTDLKGDGWMLSTPKGLNFFHTCFARGQDPHQSEWASWQMPTAANPFIDADEIEAARLELPERVFTQEYEALFSEESGNVFRKVTDAIDKGRTENEDPQIGKTYVTGIDLARVEDFSVLSVIDNMGRQVYFERFNQISWERQLEAIKRVAKLYNSRVVLDSTGVGDPIYEACRKAGLNVTPFHFTNASKENLIDGLAMAIENSELCLMDIAEQTNELLAYQYELTPSRNVRMNAPAGMHDDIVIALALAQHGRGRLVPVSRRHSYSTSY